MSTPSANRIQLSDRLRNMRFMRQKTESDVRATLEKEQIQREKEAHWTTGIDLSEHRDGLPTVIIDESTIPYEYQKYFGRRSFGNFNPVVEKRNRAGLAIFHTSTNDIEKGSENRPLPNTITPSQNPPIQSFKNPISTDSRNAPGTETRRECSNPAPIPSTSSASQPVVVSKVPSKSYMFKQNLGKHALANADMVAARSAKKRRNLRRKKSNSVQ